MSKFRCNYSIVLRLHYHRVKANRKRSFLNIKVILQGKSNDVYRNNNLRKNTDSIPEFKNLLLKALVLLTIL